jgi:hypothetical protein
MAVVFAARKGTGGSLGGDNFVNLALISRIQGALDGIRGSADEAGRHFLTVGVHEEEGAKLEPNGATIAAVAAFHEFGTRRTPRRSWLFDGIAEHEAEILEAIRRVGQAMVDRQRPMPADKAYAQLGAFIVAKLQARIRDNIPPPLSPVTIARKGSSVALIDEGRFIAAIRAKVQKE